jgi:hypothetical protein
MFLRAWLHARLPWLVAGVAFTLASGEPPVADALLLKGVWGPGVVHGASRFPIYRDLGMGLYEDRLDWATIAAKRPRAASNPNDPAYRWPVEVTAALAEAQRYRMEVALQIIGAPGWANGGKPWSWAPANPHDYAAFAAAAARRYPSVHLWMIWGEPSRGNNFQPLEPSKPFARLTAHQSSAPHRYARMLDAAYGALKRVSPHNLVIGGMTYTTGDITTAEWIENLRLPNGRPPRLDMYGHNPFSFREPNLAGPPAPEQAIEFSDLGRLAALVDRYLGRPGNRHPRLFLSEWTITTAPDQEFDIWVDPSVQASWIGDALRIAEGWPRIFALGWIHLYDEPPISFGGLIQTNGTPKPGYFAWKAG